MIVLAGASHRTAPVETREALLRSVESLPTTLASVAAEVVVLTTCNRVEVYGVADSAEAVKERWIGGLPLPEGAVYAAEEVGAVRHLFRVASSLDSLVLGENQILGQVLAAEEAAVERKTAGPILHRLFASARRCGRHVRSHTRIGEGAVSVAGIALELARKVYGTLEGRRIMLLGSGEMGRSAIQNLRGEGAVVTVLAHSRRERAEALAREAGGEVVSLEESHLSLASVDIVLCSTSCPAYIVRKPEVERAMAQRHTPLLLLDIAVPRDVDPAVRDVPGVYLFDVDGLEEIAEERREARRGEVERAERIVESGVAAFVRWLEGRDAGDVIARLETRCEEIRKGLWPEVERRLSSLPPAGREEIEYLTRLLVKRILHPPIEAVKEGDAALPVEDRAAALSILFGLQK